jgi:hypothetical protein
MFTYNDKERILSEFPNIKLSYENIVYKKVYNADINLAIPKGKKHFAWFTKVDDENVCLLMELTENKQIKDIHMVNVCFSSSLSYGTILYGTVFSSFNNTFFSTEDVFLYKGKEVGRENWKNKCHIMKQLFQKYIKQTSYNDSFVVFGMPLLSNNLEDLQSKIQKIQYPIESIQFRSFYRVNNYLIISHKRFVEEKPFTKTVHKSLQEKSNVSKPVSKHTSQHVSKHTYKKEYVFQVRPDIQNDIYHLYCWNEMKKEEYYGIANIPDYTTSVMMNRLFRNIKENQNLDALEESDDEEEFENEKEDKFVSLHKTHKMVCAYNHKFKKWYPLKLAEKNADLVFLSSLC